MGFFNLFKKNDKTTKKEPRSFNPYEAIYMLYQVGKPWNQPYYPSIFNDYYSDEHDFSDATYSRIVSYGWIEPSSKMESLSSLKVTELKEIAACYDIPLKGKKEDIVKILSEKLTEDNLSPFSVPIVSKLSALGNEIVSTYPYLEFMKKNRKSVCCNLFTFHKKWNFWSNNRPDLSFKDLLLLSLDPECFIFSSTDTYSIENSEKEYKHAQKFVEQYFNKEKK